VAVSGGAGDPTDPSCMVLYVLIQAFMRVTSASSAFRLRDSGTQGLTPWRPWVAVSGGAGDPDGPVPQGLHRVRPEPHRQSRYGGLVHGFTLV
jgi:hypothetical protein